MYLTARDIAGELQIPVRTAYEYMGQMLRLRAGRHVRVSRAAFEAWKRRQEEEPCRNSSDGSARMGASGEHGGRISMGGASRRVAETCVPRRPGDELASDVGPIRATQPRRRPA